MKTNTLLINDHLNEWLQKILTTSLPTNEVATCNLIATGSIAYIKGIKHTLIRMQDKKSIEIFINDMGMVLTATNQYEQIKYKESYHHSFIVIKTRNALNRLKDELILKTNNYS